MAKKQHRKTNGKQTKKNSPKSGPKPNRKTSKISGQKGKRRKVTISNKGGQRQNKGIKKSVPVSGRVVQSKSKRKSTTKVSKGVAGLSEGKITNKKGITEIKGTGKPERLAERIVNTSELDRKIKYQINKTGKEPKAIAVIMKVKTGEGVTKTFSELSAPDMVVNLSNTKQFIKNKVSGAMDSFADFYGGDGSDDEEATIQGVSIKFIY